MKEQFLALTFRLPREKEEDLPLVLADWPVLGCEVRDVNGDVEVSVYFRTSERWAVPQVRAELERLGASRVVEAIQPDLDWLGEYRRRARAFPVGQRFWIDPQPEAATPAPPGRIRLCIEPRQAFGTGSHESTQLMLMLLEESPPVRARVLDAGTGSGVLALAAKALGATWVLGYDLDLEAVFVALETAHLHPDWPVHFYAGPTRALAPEPFFDLILANMLVEQFVPLLPRFRQVLQADGALFLSGLLLSQRQAVAAELAACGFQVRREKHLGEWAAVVASPR